MDYGNSQLLIIAYSVSNILGVLILWAAVKKTKLARLLFVLLFAWASWTNYSTSHTKPEVYLEYSQFAARFYRGFISGWFAEHITTMVSLISIGQALIAIGMSLNGIWMKLACIGAIIFFLCIAPLGIGAGFPFSISVSLAAYFILRKDDKNYLWNFNNKKSKTIKSSKEA